MNYKTTIFLIILFGTGFYYYKNNNTDNLIIVTLFALFFIMFIGINEHMEVGSSTNPFLNKNDVEQVKILASMINEGKLKATSLDLTGDLNVGGNIKIDGRADIKENANVGGVINISGPQRTGETYNNIKTMSIDSTTIATPGVMHLYGQDNLHLLNRGGVIVNNAWAGQDPNKYPNAGTLTVKKKVQGNLNVDGNIYIPEKRSLILGNHVALSTGDNYFSLYRLSDRHTLLRASYDNMPNIVPPLHVHTPHGVGPMGRHLTPGGWN